MPSCPGCPLFWHFSMFTLTVCVFNLIYCLLLMETSVVGSWTVEYLCCPPTSPPSSLLFFLVLHSPRPFIGTPAVSLGTSSFVRMVHQRFWCQFLGSRSFSLLARSTVKTSLGRRPLGPILLAVTYSLSAKVLVIVTISCIQNLAPTFGSPITSPVCWFLPHLHPAREHWDMVAICCPKVQQISDSVLLVSFLCLLTLVLPREPKVQVIVTSCRMHNESSFGLSSLREHLGINGW